MIEVLGDTESPEFAAALALKDSILGLWPVVGTDDEYKVALVAGAKCHQMRVKDVDILVIASFPRPLVYQQFFPFETDRGVTQGIQDGYVDSLCFTVEIKGHGFEGVRFRGAEGATIVEVFYQNPGIWKNVTEQAHNQVFSVKKVYELLLEVTKKNR